MIFVTVGTHEQPFNRLIKKIDDLKQESIIKDDIVMQIGYSTYLPKFCKYEKFYPWDTMQDFYKKARIIITHGGPASFIDALMIKKIPIVVPRQAKFNEHVNNHQLVFAKQISDRGLPIIIVEDIDNIEKVIADYQKIDLNFDSNNKVFCSKLLDSIKKTMNFN